MTTLPHICLALFISLSALQPGYGSKPSPGRRPAQMPARRPPSAGQAARKVLPSVVYIEMEGAGNKPGCYGSGFFVTNDLIDTNKHMLDCGRCQTVIFDGSRRTFTITVSLSDPQHDLVLVRLVGADTPPLVRLNRTKNKNLIRLTAMDSMRAATA